jgi:hypothetical protein
MQFETRACTILFLYQNHQDTPSEIQDLYKSISIPDSQPQKTNFKSTNKCVQICIYEFIHMKLYKKTNLHIYLSIN